VVTYFFACNFHPLQSQLSNAQSSGFTEPSGLRAVDLMFYCEISGGITTRRVSFEVARINGSFA